MVAIVGEGAGVVSSYTIVAMVSLDKALPSIAHCLTAAADIRPKRRAWSCVNEKPNLVSLNRERNKARMRMSVIVLNMILLFCIAATDDTKTNGRKSWREKDITDMSDADLENIFDQWEEQEEPLEPDELPEHLRPSPKIDISKLNLQDADDVLRMTKKGKSVMMFVDTRKDIPADRAEIAMKIWQSSLQNNHIIAERYPIDTGRSLFMFREGSQAIDAKRYLLEQPELSHVTLEGQTYYREQPDNDATAPKNEKTEL